TWTDASALCKRPGHNLRRPDPPLIIENLLNHLLRIVRHREEIHVAWADEFAFFLHARFHPAQQSFPKLASEKNQRKFGDALSLYQRGDFEELIQRPKTSRHEN